MKYTRLSIYSEDCQQESKEHLNILLAEDDLLNQLFIKTMLENQGHKVVLAKNGKEAVDML